MEETRSCDVAFVPLVPEACAVRVLSPVRKDHMAGLCLHQKVFERLASEFVAGVAQPFVFAKLEVRDLILNCFIARPRSLTIQDNGDARKSTMSSLILIVVDVPCDVTQAPCGRFCETQHDVRLES